MDDTMNRCSTKCATILYLLLLYNTLGSAACPKECECDGNSVKCTGKGLKAIPKGIPLSTRELDMSYNPLLKFPSNAFLKYKQLYKLSLKSCARKGAVLLPQSLTFIGLSMNSLSTDDVKTSFKNAPRFLREIDISDNGLNLELVLDFIPSWIQKLNVGMNSLKVLKKDQLARFVKMKHLRMYGCKIARIEPGAFNELPFLSVLVLNSNRLRSLSAGLFRHSKNIKVLFLDRNNLTSVPDLHGIGKMKRLVLSKNNIKHFNAMKLGVNIISQLEISYCQVETFSLKGIRLTELDLAHNKIVRLEAVLFRGIKRIRNLSLQSNNINYISPEAFKGIEIIAELYLQRNKISFLPRDVFKGMRIEKLILYANRLSNISGVLDAMKSPPDLLLLFYNHELKNFRASDYAVMKNGSSLYVTCKNFKTLVETEKLKTNVRCSPSIYWEIRTPSKSFNRDGFTCTYKYSSHVYVCQPCQVGYHADNRICEAHNEWKSCGGKCLQCQPGSFYQDEMAALSCKNCQKGQFVPPELSPGKSPLDCLTCPSGTDTNSSANYRACKCLNGFARTYRFGECKRCTEKGFECNKDYPRLKRRYWMTWNISSNGSLSKQTFKAFILNMETQNENYDRNTMKYTDHLPVPHKCPIHESCLGGVDADCAKGYTGVLCAVCDQKYSRQFDRCIKCPEPFVAVLQFVGYIALFFFVCLLITWADKVSLNKEGSSDNLGQIEMESRTLADVILSNLKIVLGFYQVLSGVIHAFSYIRWPENLKRAVGAFEYLEFAVLRIPSLRCIKPEWEMNSIRDFWFVLIATISFPVFVLLYFFVKKAILYCKTGTRDTCKERPNDCARNCFRAVALFLFTTYPITSRRIVQILPISCHSFCVNSQKNRCLQQWSYLRSDYSVECLSMSHGNKVTLIIAYVSLLIPLGLPFCLLFLLWRYSPKTKEDTAPVQEMQLPGNGFMQDEDIVDVEYINASLLDSTKHNRSVATEALKFVYENYTQSSWYWETIEMIRKLIMTVGIALFLQHTKIGLGGIITIAMTFTILQALKNPIKDKFENFLQLLSVSIIPINLSIGAVLQANEIADADLIEKGKDTLALGLLLVFINSLLIVLVFGRFIRAIVKKICHCD